MDILNLYESRLIPLSIFQQLVKGMLKERNFQKFHGIFYHGARRFSSVSFHDLVAPRDSYLEFNSIPKKGYCYLDLFQVADHFFSFMGPSGRQERQNQMFATLFGADLSTYVLCGIIDLEYFRENHFTMSENVDRIHVERTFPGSHHFADILTLMRATGKKLGGIQDNKTLSESSVNLGSLAMMQGSNSLSIDDPVTIADKAQLTSRYIQVKSDHWSYSIKLRMEDLFTESRSRKESDRDWKKKLRKIRHDYVSSLLMENTDMRLSDFGVDSKLTPDFISRDGKTVLELATCYSSDDKSLHSSYNSKILAYRDELKDTDMDYFILVVSPDKIMTNCWIRDDMVSEFCRRCREGISIQSTISIQTGYMLGVSNDQEEEQIGMIKDCIDALDRIPKPVSWDFNLDLQDDSLKEKASSDDVESRRILNDSWTEVSKMEIPKGAEELDMYLKSLSVKETRNDNKRVFVFPAMLPKYEGRVASIGSFSNVNNLSSEDEDIDSLLQLWKSGINNGILEQRKTPENVQFVNSLSEALTDEILEEKHHLTKAFSYSPLLNKSQMDRIALSGPGAKFLSSVREISEHEKHQKKSFSIDSPIEDIEEFFSGDTLEGFESDYSTKATPIELIERSSWKTNRRNISKKLFTWALESGIARMSSFISSLCLEMSYEYKVPNKDDGWSCKPMRDYDAMLLTRSTGSHIFFSILAHKKDTHIWDTGRLGAKIFQVGEFLISDFGSLVEASLEHFIKAGPYMTSLMSYTLQHMRIPFLTQKAVLSKEFWRTIKSIFIIYLNNKNDLESLVMDCRYLYMRVLQRYDNDPYKFIDRLPEVFRSRLSIFFLHRIIWVMKFYRLRKPKQIKIKSLPESDPNSVRYIGLRSIFHNGPVTLDQLIDSFYFSYPTSKEKGRVGDRSFKIVKKIIIEEKWARENIKEFKNILWSARTKPEKHYWSSSLLKFMIDARITKWKALMGDNYQDQILMDIYNDFRKKNLGDIATLKASSKDHYEPQINLPNITTEELTGKAYVEKLKEINPKLQGRRPRVISSLLRLVKRFIEEEGDEDPTIIKLLPYCMKKLIKAGYIYSDCFPKDQHGGIREIHVLQIEARIVQFFIERTAVCMSSLFQTDSILHPKRKDSFMKDHEVAAQAKIGNHITMCKSADATKWCQRHHVSKFYFMMNRITGGKLNSLFYLGFYLWTVKRIAIPNEMVAIMHASKFEESDNTTLLWMQKKFLRGQMPFVCEDSNTIEVKFGMWQGIWHKVSSVFHSLIQEFYLEIANVVLKLRQIPALMSVIQGSDDSACSISFKMRGKKTDIFVYLLLKWKEEFQKFLSIWPSESKSSIGTILLVEYNSEWWYRGKILKPTFRWVSACLETTIVERFYERTQIFYNQLSTAVESGLCTLTASVVQKCQAWLHYSMMGFSNHVLRKHVMELLLSFPHPSLGFFPLEGEEYCGLPGFDYSLFVLSKEKNINVQSEEDEEINPSMLLDYDDKLDHSLRSSLRNVRINFGNKKLWEDLVHEADIGVFSDAVVEIKKSPKMLYERANDWRSEKVSLILKLFQQGVRASLSSHQPTIRSAASSAYLFNRPCLTDLLSPMGSKKLSLTRALTRKITEQQSNQNKENSFMSHDIMPRFIHESEYEEFYKYIDDLREGFSYQEVPYGRHSKVIIPVWGELSSLETPLIDIIKRQFFSMNTVHVSQTVFKRMWDQCKIKFRFLRDTYEETVKSSKMDHMQLYNFFLSASKKSRSLTLQDTTVKAPDLISAISRIYWPQVKLRTEYVGREEKFRSVRHNVFCITSYFYTEMRKISLIKQYFRNSGLKDLELRDCPQRHRKLKVILDWSLDKDKVKAISNIPLIRTGVLGFFSRRQDREIREGKKPVYSGEGVWVGEVCGIPTKIICRNNTLLEIRIKRMSDTINLSKRLARLIKELRLIPSERPLASSSYYYLNTKDHFIVSPMPVQNCSPVVIDSQMSDSELQEVLERDWFVEVQETTIRLCIEDRVPEGDVNKITLLSESFVSSDWNAALVPQSKNEPRPKAFTLYCRGMPASPMDLLEEMNYVPDRTTTASILNRILDTDVEKNGLSIRGMRENLRNYILMRKATQDQKNIFFENKLKEMKEESESFLVSEKEIDELLGFSEPFEEQIKGITSWADEVIQDIDDSEKGKLRENIFQQYPEDFEHHEDNEMDLEGNFDSIDQERDTLEEIQDLLFETDLDEMGMKHLEFSLLKGMPIENSFWADLIATCISERDGDEVLNHVLNNDKTVTDLRLMGPSGVFFSLLLNQNLYKEHSPPLSISTQRALSRASSRKLISKEEMEALIFKTSREISEIDSVLEGLPEVPKQILINKRNELELLLRSFSNLDKDDIFPQVDYWEFMNILIPLLRKENVWEKTYMTSDLEGLTTLLIGDIIEGCKSQARMKIISELEFNSVTMRIWDRVISTLFLRALSWAFGLSISFLVHGETKFTHEPKFLNKDITINYAVNE